MRTINGIEELKALTGQEIGTSAWHRVTQDRITGFAEATDDFEAIHLDPRRGIEAGLGGTIAHGLYTLALGPKFLYEIFTMQGHSLGLNYGFDTVRFTSTVPVDSRLRMVLSLVDHEEIDGGTKFRFRQVFEVEGREKPACVAESVVAYFN